MEKILAKALGQDVSQLAAAEKQLLLGRLLARLAHEIRNPLSSLDIHVQLLEEDLTELAPHLKERTSARLEIIHGEIHRLENIVKQFLRLAGPSALDLERVDIRKVLTHVCDLLKPEAATRDIQITLTAPADLPMIVADPGQITQGVVNLIINAIQAIDRNGRIDVSVTAASQQLDPLRSDSGMIEVQVRDTGPGVPPDKLSAVFDPFFTTKPEGSGLGLWIAQQIVLAHGGAIDVMNQPTGGAVFVLRLPLHGSQHHG